MNVLSRAMAVHTFFCFPNICVNLSHRNHANLTRPVRVLSAVVDESNPKSIQFTLAFGAKAIPHPDKVEKGGEDAYFMSDFGGGVLGVADGVSGWAEENVDPALFSKEFVHHMSDHIVMDEVSGDPKALLERAYAATTAIGAATVIVATLLGQEGILRVANVGDCGLRIVRDGKVVFATSPQQHYFDCPFQFSSEIGGQTAEDAKIHEIDVEDGDVVVMGSDGLFDNVYDRDIAATVSMYGGKDQQSAERAADALAKLANKNSRDPKYDSPYSVEAIYQGYDVPFWKKLLGEKLTGGKIDDITVVVGLVRASEVQSNYEESKQL